MGQRGYRHTATGTSKGTPLGLASTPSFSLERDNSGISKRSGLRQTLAAIFFGHFANYVSMISSAKRIGAGFAYPIIAPIVASHTFVTSRISASATSGETNLLLHSNIEYGRTIARGSPSSSKPHEWHPQPTAFAMLN